MRTIYKSVTQPVNMQTQLRTLPAWERTPHRSFPRVKGGGKSRPHSGEKSRSGPIFSAGETVKQTGIYEVVHESGHRSPHEVVMLSGDAFTPCATCEAHVRFRLVRTAPYIFQDEDFEEPE